MSSKTDPRTNLLVEILDQAFDKPAWHGANLRGSLRGLTVKQLLWRESTKRHNIWEIALHTTYWKYIIHRKLTGGKRGSFPRKPSDWPKLLATADKKAWKADLDLLIEYHELLKTAILDFAPSKLNSHAENSKYRNVRLIYGAASHDLYHAGQIQLLKRMQRG